MYELNDQRAAVTAVQRLLRQAGYNVKPDGIFGRETEEAVKHLQADYGLSVTGRVDLETFELLVFIAEQYSGYNPAAIIPKTLSGGIIAPGEESNVITIIQAMLKELEGIYDFDRIMINGVFDENTEKAILEIQRANMLPENGIIDSYTWNALVGEYEKYRE